MSKEILINVGPREKRVAVVKEARLQEFYIERPEDKNIVSNIYKGKIEAVIPSIGGAFVDIGMAKKGFLYLSEIEGQETAFSKEADSSGRATAAPRQAKKDMYKDIKRGQEVLVQVVKDSFGTKGPRLSCDIGIAGRYLVLMPKDDQIGVSKRIEDEVERKRLRQALVELKLPSNLGFIVRTAACGKSKNELLRDARFLINLWQRLDKISKRKTAPCLIYEEYDLTLRVIRDSLSEEISKIWVDFKPEFYRIKNFMRMFLGDFVKKLEFYRGDDLFEEKNMDRQVTQIFETKVYLKSKAYIIIEPTEGLVVIDVNSGGFKERVGQEEAAFRVNCEAAVEAAHQLILRDLGGIIVIDFIDMEKEHHRREVLKVLKQALSNDKAKYDILGISRFGVIEMTRERVHNTVQTMSFQLCPYCSGKGKVKSALTMSIYSLKEIKRFLKGKQLRQIEVALNPLVVDEIQKNKVDLVNIERKYRVRINLSANPALHIEDVKITQV